MGEIKAINPLIIDPGCLHVTCITPTAKHKTHHFNDVRMPEDA